MIDRRRPIQSVLANRKMFANGGAVSTEPSFVPYVTRADYESRTGGPSSREDSWFLPGATSATGDSASNGSTHVPFVTREDFESRIGGPSPHPDEWFLQPGQPVPEHPDRSGPTTPTTPDYPPLPEPRFPVATGPDTPTLRLTAEEARRLTSPVRNNPNAVTDAMGNVIDLGQGLIPIAEPGFFTGNWRKDARTQFGFLEDPHEWRNPTTGEEVTMPDSSWIPPSPGWEFRDPLVPDSPWQQSPYDPEAPWVAEQAALPVGERFRLPSDFPDQDAAGIMRARAGNITDPGLNYPTETIDWGGGTWYTGGPYTGMPVGLAQAKSAAIGDYAHEGGPSTWEAYTPPATDPGLDFPIEDTYNNWIYSHGPYAGLDVNWARRKSRELGPERWGSPRSTWMAQGGAVGFANGGMNKFVTTWGPDDTPFLEQVSTAPQGSAETGISSLRGVPSPSAGISSIATVAPTPTGVDLSIQEQMNLHPHLRLPTWVEPELRGYGGQEVYREGEFKSLTPQQARQRAVAQYAAGRLPAPGAGIGAFSPMGAVPAGGGNEGQGMYSYPGDEGKPSYWSALDKAFDLLATKDFNNLTPQDAREVVAAGRKENPSNFPSWQGLMESLEGRQFGALAAQLGLPSALSVAARAAGIFDMPTREQLEAVYTVYDVPPDFPGQQAAMGKAFDDFSGMGQAGLGSYSSGFGVTGGTDPSGLGSYGEGTEGYYASGGAVTNTARPQGIMASSQPLMEAVASDAVNPAGGGALIDRDGTLSMAQGGAVGFQQGGANYAPLWGSRTQIGLGASPQDMIARSEMGRGELAQKMFPYEASTGPLTFLNRPGPAGLGQPPGPSRPIVSALRVPTDFLDQSIRSLSQINASLGRILVDTAEFIGSKRDWSGINTVEDVANAYGQIEAVNAALRRAPEVEGVSSEEVGNAISRIAKDTVSQDPNITGKKLSGIIAENIRDMFESGYLMAREDVELDPNEPDFAALADEDMPFGPRSDDMAGMESMPGGGEIQPAEAPAVVDQEPPAEEPAVVDQEAADADRAAFLEGDPGFDEAELRGAEAVAKTFDKKEMPADEATKTLEDHLARFKEVMPEYEGATEQERGWMILEAGLRVMAGQSPNAITNIAKGLQGLGPQLAKDAKEKRAWNRQVDLSAAKYALAAMDKDRALEISLAAEGRKRPYELVANKAFKFEGRLIEKGQAFPATEQQIRDGLLEKFPLTYAKTYIANAKATAALAKKALGGRVNAESFSSSGKKYLDDLDSFKSSVRMKAVLRESANIVTKGDVLGGTALLKDYANKAMNALGVQMNERSKFLQDYTSKDREEYNAKQKRLGTLMATQLLREGSKTLSDYDRRRVEELIGALTGVGESVFASEDVLKDRLINLELSLDDAIVKSSNSMLMLEEQWGREMTKGGTSLGNLLLSARRRGLGETTQLLAPTAKAYKLSDIYNRETRKFYEGFRTRSGSK